MFSCPPAAGQTVKPPKFVEIRVGLGNCYKAGLWTQVDLALRGGDEALAGVVLVETDDGDGVPSVVPLPGKAQNPKRVQVLPGQFTPIRLYVRFGRTDSRLTARFVVGDKLAAMRTFEASLEPDEVHYAEAADLQPIYAVLGASTLGVDAAISRLNLETDQQPLTARVARAEELPTRWYGYEGIDAMLIDTDQVDLFRNLPPDSVQIEALDRWVWLGGRLVLSAGRNAESAFGPASPWRRFLPGKLEKVESLWQTAALESYCGGSTPLALGGKDAAIPVARLRDVEGVVELREADLPLVVRAPRGLGQIIFFAAGLDQFSLRKWADRPRLVGKLIDLPPEKSAEAQENQELAYSGYSDLAGQLRSALDQFTGVRVISFGWVALLIIIYILLIGPGDFLFLRRIVKRMQWTWLTFPLIVLGVSLAAYYGAYALKGRQLRLNQVDLVDVDVSSGLVRGTTWLNLFSPRMETYNLHLKPRLPDGAEAKDHGGYFAWLGLPGYGFGGMHPRGAGPSAWGQPYFFSPDLKELEKVPVQVWSTKSFTGRWFTKTGNEPVALEADLSDNDLTLQGTLRNPLTFPLTDCLLAYDRWAYEIPRIEPGESVRIGAETSRSELNNLLTGRHMVAENPMDQYRIVSTPYDPESDNTGNILRMMMFYQAAGGRRYTQLSNGYQTFVDCSLLLQTGRAILVGRGPAADEFPKQGAQLMRGNQPLSHPDDRHAVFYRFVFPVKKK
ncbi:MAG: hypothetical protein JXB10_05575 [Pirellulales bacterium]|nr:hypothetical protein [Pirellulales bacterium]